MSAFFDIDYPDYKPVEIKLISDEDFLKVRETLSRIGVASKKDKILYQSCHILHKQGRYFITHFKELFALDGKEADLSYSDLQRRNEIAKLLSKKAPKTSMFSMFFGLWRLAAADWARQGLRGQAGPDRAPRLGSPGQPFGA